PVTGWPTTFGQARQAKSVVRWSLNAFMRFEVRGSNEEVRVLPSTFAPRTSNLFHVPSEWVMKRAAFALLFLTASIPAHAWTRAADHRIALKGVEMGPPDLRLVIDQFRDEFLRGVDTPIDRAKLRPRIEAEARSIVQMIRTNKPMPLIVE